MKLNGIGRKIELDNTTGVLKEGFFADDNLNGFGRCISSDGTMAIGWFKNDHMHGYGRRVGVDGVVVDKLWEETNWLTRSCSATEEFIGYDVGYDLCAQKIDFSKYLSMDNANQRHGLAEDAKEYDL